MWDSGFRRKPEPMTREQVKKSLADAEANFALEGMFLSDIDRTQVTMFCLGEIREAEFVANALVGWSHESFSAKVLDNRFNIRDAARLEYVERRLSAGRLALLPAYDFSGPVNAEYLQMLHHFIFQDIYDWAGLFRRVEIFKGKSSFVAPEGIEFELMDLFDEVAQCDFQLFSKQELVHMLAHVLHSLNEIHPFLDGNGRTSMVLVSRLAQDAGYDLSWAGFNENLMRTAMIAANRGDLRKLELYIVDGLIARV